MNGCKLDFCEIDIDLKKSDILVSRVHHKMGPLEKTAREEKVVQQLIDSGKILLLQKVDGYNIYRIRN
jgi:hypothetical protein